MMAELEMPINKAYKIARKEKLRYIKLLLPGYRAKDWQFDLRICPDCDTLQIMKPMRLGSRCDNRECKSEVVECTRKGKHFGELMWANENWD